MIYLDHAATTPVPRAVADAMYEVLTGQFGNPSSQYPMGLEMKRRVESWRRTVADALGCAAKQLFFTSCGTEADNWAVTAACWQNRHLGRHIVTTAVEHSAVLEACRWMERQGYEVTYLAPAQDGSITALPHRRDRPGPGGEEPADAAAHRRGPGLFEGPLLRQNAGGGLHHHLRSQDRGTQGHRRPVHRSPGPEPKAPAGRRRAGERPPGRHRGHGPDRRLCQGRRAAGTTPWSGCPPSPI